MPIVADSRAGLDQELQTGAFGLLDQQPQPAVVHAEVKPRGLVEDWIMKPGQLVAEPLELEAL